MVEYTIDDIRGPTVAREMAQLKEFVLAKFNGAISDAEAAAAAAATAAANAVLANTVKKTGEASQSIAGNVGVTGTLDAAAIGSGSTPIVCGDLTAFGNVSLDDTILQGNLSGADSSALINLSGVGSVLVPTPTSNSEAATKKYVDDALDAYAPMMRTTGNQNVSGIKNFSSTVEMSNYEAWKITKGVGSPAMSGNAAASQQIIDIYSNTQDGSDWMIRDTIFQAANTKNYSRILYLRRYDDNNQILQATFTFAIDANGKGHISVSDNDGTVHQVI